MRHSLESLADEGGRKVNGNRGADAIPGQSNRVAGCRSTQIIQLPTALSCDRRAGPGA
jgi:hypothetical protein